MSRDLSRQSFLGPESERIFGNAKVGVIGAGGGGSHEIQQLAHIGWQRYVVCDLDIVEDSNLNRLVGANRQDVADKRPKIEIATRLIRGLNPYAEVAAHHGPWQGALDQIASCSIVLGCLDSFKERDELERFCRQNLTPYVDIGMDVIEVGDHFHIVGQVALSMPGAPCLRCMGIVTESAIREEVQRYGAAGPRPQVVWPNGLLASAAVGIAVGLLCPWQPEHQAITYLEYDGNSHTLTPSPRIEYLHGVQCPHHPPHELGSPFFALS